MRSYELVFILNPELDEDGLADVSQQVTGLIERNAGQVTQVEHWGLRRLAYPLRNKWEGQYVLMQLDMEPQGVAGLERDLGLAEQVVRHLIVRVE